jgi:hypothetical protein
MKSVCLRYFNACGADASGEIGEAHFPETHLIPLVLEVPLGKREKCFIFGGNITILIQKTTTTRPTALVCEIISTLQTSL